MKIIQIIPAPANMHVSMVCPSISDTAAEEYYFPVVCLALVHLESGQHEVRPVYLMNGLAFVAGELDYSECRLQLEEKESPLPLERQRA